METISESERLLQRRATQIMTLALIARTNGSLLTVEDAASLTDINGMQALERRLRGRRRSSEYHVRDGFVIETGGEGQGEELARVSKALDMKARAAKYVKRAQEFAAFASTREASLFAVSGSTSYKSVSVADDLDFFCITRKDSLWLFLGKNLLLARAFRLIRRDSPRICFSYVVDESYALGEFSRETDALFARDALSTIVLYGDAYYGTLLDHSRWMARYFPKAYGQRTMGLAQSPDIRPRTASFRTKLLNLAMHFLVGHYIALKSSMLNRAFAKQGKFSSIFNARIGVDHCVFESARYSQLRSMYRGLDGGVGPEPQQRPPADGE
jgi:hypothetical protein